MHEGYEYPKVLYRAESHWYPGDLFRDDYVELQFNEFRVVKHTPCGVWIALYSYAVYQFRQDGKAPAPGLKWVSLTGRKRYAYQTKEDALESLRMRKIWQERYAKSALEKAQKTIEIIENMQGGKHGQSAPADGKGGQPADTGIEGVSVLRL